jgi:hypothetical protein
MAENYYEKIKKLVSSIDKIISQGRLAVVRANNQDFVVNNYKIVKNYIILYFNKDYLASFRLDDIQSVDELIKGEWK